MTTPIMTTQLADSPPPTPPPSMALTLLQVHSFLVSPLSAACLWAADCTSGRWVGMLFG